MPLQLAAPNVAGAGESTLDYIERVIEWSDLVLDSSVVELLKSEPNLISILWDHGLYPERDTIDTLIKQSGIESYSANDVVPVVDLLIERASSLEKACDIDEVLVEDTDLDPDMRGHSVDIDREVERLIGIMLRAEAEQTCTGILCGTERSDLGGRTLSSSTCLKAVQRHFGRSTDFTEVVLTGRNQLCYLVEDVLACTDMVRLWTASAEDDIDSRVYAIRLAIWRLSRTLGRNMEWPATDCVRLHPDFIRYCRKHNFDDNAPAADRLLRACADTVVGLDNDTHPLRSSDGGGSPQIARNADKAWRRKIDSDFRLHYWRLPDSRFEFAAIDTHHHFSIPY
jgi:hypothetical protein